MHHSAARSGPAGPARASTTSWPDFDLERTSVRVVLLDPADRLLLFATIDSLMVQSGMWWELPGGGMEPGETIVDTAVREVAEETGLVLAADRIEVETGGRARWRRNVTYLRRGVRTLQHEYVVVARIDEPAPDLDRAGRTPEELRGLRRPPLVDDRAGGRRGSVGCSILPRSPARAGGRLPLRGRDRGAVRAVELTAAARVVVLTAAGRVLP